MIQWAMSMVQHRRVDHKYFVGSSYSLLTVFCAFKNCERTVRMECFRFPLSRKEKICPGGDLNLGLGRNIDFDATLHSNIYSLQQILAGHLNTNALNTMSMLTRTVKAFTITIQF